MAEKTELEKACDYFSCRNSPFGKRDAMYYMGVLLCGMQQNGIGGGGGDMAPLTFKGNDDDETGPSSDLTMLQAGLMLGEEPNPKWFGAKFDAKRYFDPVLVNGSNVVTCASASFDVTTDIGKLIWVVKNADEVAYLGRTGFTASAASNIITFDNPHGLLLNDQIHITLRTQAGSELSLAHDKTYFVKTIESSSQIKISDTVGGPIVLVGSDVTFGLMHIPVRIIGVTDANTVTVSTKATSSVNAPDNRYLVYGSDDTVALKAASTYIMSPNTRNSLRLPAGGTIFTGIPFDFLTGDGTTLGPQVSGSGSGRTLLFPAPHYDLEEVHNHGMIYRTDCKQGKLTDMYIDGSYIGFDGSNFSAIVDTGTSTMFDNIWTNAFRGLTQTWKCQGADSSFRRIHNEYSGFWGINVAGTGATFMDCHTGNCASNCLRISSLNSVGAFSGRGFKWFGGLVDEGGSDPINITDSNDVVFIGARLTSGQNPNAPFLPTFAMVVTNSKVRFDSCEVTPWLDDSISNASGLSVDATSIVRASDTRFSGIQTGVALNNAGRFEDLGGNTFSHSTGGVSDDDIAVVNTGTFVCGGIEQWELINFAATGTVVGSFDGIKHSYWGDTNGGATTLILPVNPYDGQAITVVDKSGSFASANAFTLDANGKTVNGGATYDLNTDSGVWLATYIKADLDWNVRQLA